MVCFAIQSCFAVAGHTVRLINSANYRQRHQSCSSCPCPQSKSCVCECSSTNSSRKDPHSSPWTVSSPCETFVSSESRLFVCVVCVCLVYVVSFDMSLIGDWIVHSIQVNAGLIPLDTLQTIQVLIEVSCCLLGLEFSSDNTHSCVLKLQRFCLRLLVGRQRALSFCDVRALFTSLRPTQRRLQRKQSRPLSGRNLPLTGVFGITLLPPLSIRSFYYAV